MVQVTEIQAVSQAPSLPETAIAIGVDIGGTKISAAQVSLKDGIQRFEKTATPSQGKAFVAAIETLVKGICSLNSVSPVCLGIASAGTINSDTGEIFGSTGNLPALKEIGSLKASLEDSLQMPVFIENDANAAAYGEARMGAAKGIEEVLMITLGTGVGAGFLVHNHLVRGAHFSAAEGGHIAISMNHERLCTCGKWDCWETFASGTGLAETARLQLRRAPNASASRILREGTLAIDAVTTHDVIAAWHQQDTIAQEILDLWHYHIATGLGSLLNVLDPAITVIGGGMAEFVNYEKLHKLTQDRAMYKDIRIVPAKLGNEAGIMGAAILAMDRVYS